MLVRLLSKSDKDCLLQCAELLAISDDPILWDGKQRHEITSTTDLSRISLKRDDLETAIIFELKSEGINRVNSSIGLGSAVGGVASIVGAMFPQNVLYDQENSNLKSVELMLIDRLKTYPLGEVESPGIRIQASTLILKEILDEKKNVDASVPKLMLFELMLVALRDGNISDIELALLKDFQNYHQLEDFIYDDLMEQAETMNREVNKTIAIILE